VKTNPSKTELVNHEAATHRKDNNFRELHLRGPACTCDTLFKAIARLYLAGFSADNHARIFPMIFVVMIRDLR
jgi:hypothetical protein